MPFAQGRACDVFDLGDGRVLRRRRDGGPAEPEGQVMRWAREHGVPVPEVLAVEGPDLVMAKVVGPSLLDPDAQVSPPEVAAALVALHHALDDVPAPPGLPVLHGPGDRLLHGDLHPGNVLLGEDGPVLIDWTNAGAGDRAADVAETWLLMACFDPPGLERGPDGSAPAEWEQARAALLGPFLAAVDRAAAAGWLPVVAARRFEDVNTSPAEVAVITAFVEAETAR